MGPSKVTQTTQQKLSPEQTKLLNMGIKGVEGAQANAVPLPSVPGFNENQTAAQNNVLAAAGTGGAVSGAANDLAGAQHFLSGDVLDINKNPALQRTIDAAVRPIEESFTRVVLPGLRTDAVNAGALGNTRNKMATVNAAENTQRQIGDTSAGIATDAYKAGLDALVKGTAIAPGSMQALLFPAAAQEAVGSQQRDLQVAQGSQDFNQNTLDFTRALQLLNAAGGTPGGGTTASVNPATGGGGVQGLISQGLGAASLLAAVLPALSDRRFKQDATIVGKTLDGQNIWRFHYHGQTEWRLGLMADEVMQHHPDAVGEIGGIRYVDLEKAIPTS
jgi:hypothetical protein